MNIVKIISSRIVDSKRLVKFLRLGKNDVQESHQASPFGIDSNPISGLVAVYAPTMENGKPVVIGYINKNQIAGIGETRIFSTDDQNTLKTYIHLLNDGTMEIGGNSKNMVRFQELETGFNQLKSDFNALVTLFNTHVHAGVTTGPASSAVTPTPGTSSAADISGAKIDEIRTQ